MFAAVALKTPVEKGEKGPGRIARNQQRSDTLSAILRAPWPPRRSTSKPMSLRSHGAFILIAIVGVGHDLCARSPSANTPSRSVSSALTPTNVADVIALPLVFVKQRDWRGSLRTGIHP